MSILNMKGVLVGVLATITMDALTSILYKLQLIAPLHPRLLGRWFASIARGQLLVNDIGQVPSVNREVAIAVPYALRHWDHARGFISACEFDPRT